MIKTKNLSLLNKIIIIAFLTALGAVLQLIEIPYIIPFLKIDLSELVILIAAVFGFWIAFSVVILKALIAFLINPGDPIGILALLLGSFIILVSFYLFRYLLKFNLITSLFIMTIAFATIMTILNYFFITPLYAGVSFNEINQTNVDLLGQSFSYFTAIILVYLPFNLLKGALISVIYYPINKTIFNEVK